MIFFVVSLLLGAACSGTLGEWVTPCSSMKGGSLVLSPGTPYCDMLPALGPNHHAVFVTGTTQTNLHSAFMHNVIYNNRSWANSVTAPGGNYVSAATDGTNYYAIGSTPNFLLVSGFDENGRAPQTGVSQRKLVFPNHPNTSVYASRLRWTTDGDWLLCGWMNPVAGRNSLFARLSADMSTVTFAQVASNTKAEQCIDVVQAGNYYVWVGHLVASADNTNIYVMRTSKSLGSNANSFEISVGSTSIATAVGVVPVDNDLLIYGTRRVTATGNLEIFLNLISADCGTLRWSRIYGSSSTQESVYGAYVVPGSRTVYFVGATATASSSALLVFSLDATASSPSVNWGRKYTTGQCNSTGWKITMASSGDLVVYGGLNCRSKDDIYADNTFLTRIDPVSGTSCHSSTPMTASFTDVSSASRGTFSSLSPQAATLTSETDGRYISETTVTTNSLCSAASVPSGTCWCEDGRTWSPLLQACMSCNSPCKTCSIRPTNCTSCSLGFYHNYGCPSICPGKYFGNTVTKTCDPCHQNCATCVAQSASSCLTCTSHTFPAAATPPFTCTTCHTTCAECSGGLSTNCTSCNAPLFFFPKQCIVRCPNTTWPNATGRTCAACHSTCGTCVGPTGSNCTSCDGLYLKGSTCVQAGGCGSGYYGDSASSTCKMCHDYCSTCTDGTATSCASCATGKYKFGLSTCVTSCPTKTWTNSMAMKCENCWSSCKTCNGSTISHCLSCDDTLFLDGSTCVYTCSGSKYGNTATRKCEACHSECDTCSGRTQNECLSCKPPRFLLGNSCVLNCTGSTFPDPGARKCETCHTTCQTCTGKLATQCLSCEGSLFLDGKSCAAQCSGSRYGRVSTHTCEPCHASCFRCTGPEDTSCAECTAGYYPGNGKCQPCDPGKWSTGGAAPCTTCHITVPCTDCHASTGKCKVCPAGSRTNEYTCAACEANTWNAGTAATCARCGLGGGCGSCDPTNGHCTSCARGTYMNGTGCVACEAGKWSQANASACEACVLDTKCESCSAETGRCSKCQPGHFFANGTECFPCPEMQYSETGAKAFCDPCSKTGTITSVCTGCSPVTGRCNKCQEGYHIEGNTCAPGEAVPSSVVSGAATLIPFAVMTLCVSSFGVAIRLF